MKRLLLFAGCVLAVCVPAGQARRMPPERPAGCHRMFWLGEGIRFAHRVFDGARPLSGYDRRHLRRVDHCQHNEHARRWLRRFDGRLAREHAGRMREARFRAAHPFSQAKVSWYDDSGTTASGWHASYGFADCGSSGPCYPFGTRIEFCYNGCVVAVADDHGPYVGGRAFDLGASTAQAIGFSGVDTVSYRLR